MKSTIRFVLNRAHGEAQETLRSIIVVRTEETHDYYGSGDDRLDIGMMLPKTLRDRFRKEPTEDLDGYVVCRSGQRVIIFGPDSTTEAPYDEFAEWCRAMDIKAAPYMLNDKPIKGVYKLEGEQCLIKLRWL